MVSEGDKIISFNTRNSSCFFTKFLLTLPLGSALAFSTKPNKNSIILGSRWKDDQALNFQRALRDP